MIEYGSKRNKEKLKKSLDKQRYQHTLGVMYTAGCLAMANGYSIEKAMLAGLLHDCAKCLSTEKKIGLCVKKNIDITEVEISNPGCYMLRQAWCWLRKSMVLRIRRYCMP